MSKNPTFLIGPLGSQRQGTLAEVVQQSITEEAISPMRIMLEAQEVERRRCWLDGDRCPYGHPNGMFTERPRSFCKYGAFTQPVGKPVFSLQKTKIGIEYSASLRAYMPISQG